MAAVWPVSERAQEVAGISRKQEAPADVVPAATNQTPGFSPTSLPDPPPEDLRVRRDRRADGDVASVVLGKFSPICVFFCLVSDRFLTNVVADD